ncbi:MAG: acetyl-CoA carboxylase, carboxyltransferase subunit beta [Candidatus Omnitrophota bacterium]
MNFFKRDTPKFGLGKKKKIPDGLWTKCPNCTHFIFTKSLMDGLSVCPKCDYHFTLTCWDRVKSLTDENSFIEFYENLTSQDPLEFVGPKTYKDKVREAQKSTGLKDAVIVGEAKTDDKPLALAVTDSRFIMGSMGSVVGEKLARIIELACEKRLPVVIVSGSGGGARMYEGLFSLMQMAKTCGALQRLKENGLPYIAVLTHPTMAGILASFAGIGDVTIAEPNALIGFTGPRVIKQTIKQDLPKGFQTSEFNLEHGLIDMVSHRKDLKANISKLLDYLS